jgi:hypothetical protein
MAAVRAYLGRVGAKPVSFFAATSEITANGYPKVTGRVTFSRAGEAKVWGSIEAPTDAEADGIRQEFEQADAAGELPRLVTLAALAELPGGVSPSDPNTFVCHDFDGRVVMIHQRYDTRDGGKGFIPWTRWSDGRWHKMEPEVMPFFGLPGTRIRAPLHPRGREGRAPGAGHTRRGRGCTVSVAGGESAGRIMSADRRRPRCGPKRLGGARCSPLEPHRHRR